MERMRNVTIKRVTDDIERYHFNTAIAALMEYVNFLQGIDVGTITTEAIDTLIVLISPFAPHIAEELWERTGHEGRVVAQGWPTYDESKIATDTVTIVVQVNGKLRDRIEVAADASQDETREAALKSGKVTTAMGGKEPRKVIVVPGKLVNIVV